MRGAVCGALSDGAILVKLREILVMSLRMPSGHGFGEVYLNRLAGTGKLDARIRDRH